VIGLLENVTASGLCEVCQCVMRTADARGSESCFGSLQIGDRVHRHVSQFASWHITGKGCRGIRTAQDLRARLAGFWPAPAPDTRALLVTIARSWNGN
jgi:hypothetical protein